MKDIEKASKPANPGHSLPEAAKEGQEDKLIDMISKINGKYEMKSCHRDVMDLFDVQGRKKISGENVREALTSIGHAPSEEDVRRVMLMANPRHTGEVSKVEFYKMIDGRDGNEVFRGQRGREEIERAFEENLREKRRATVMAILTNDIRRVHKEVYDSSKDGFLEPERAAEILKQSLKRWESADPGVVDEYVKGKTCARGVSTETIMEDLADNKVKMRLEVDAV